MTKNEPPICCAECGQLITGITVSGNAKFAQGCPRCGKYMGELGSDGLEHREGSTPSSSTNSCEISVVQNEFEIARNALHEALKAYNLLVERNFYKLYPPKPVSIEMDKAALMARGIYYAHTEIDPKCEGCCCCRGDIETIVREARAKAALDASGAKPKEQPVSSYAGVDNAAYSTNDRTKAADSVLSPAPNDQPVEAIDKDNLWWMCTTDSPEAQQAFIVNVLRGTIKIPEELNARAIGSYLERHPVRESSWHLIETAPKDREILGFGSYLYPGDKDRTTYRMLIEWDRDSWCSYEGNHADGFFTHWQELTEPTEIEGQL